MITLSFLIMVFAAIISGADNSKMIFIENRLYRKKWHSGLSFVLVSEIKYQIKNNKNIEIVENFLINVGKSGDVYYQPGGKDAVGGGGAHNVTNSLFWGGDKSQPIIPVERKP